MYPDWFDSSKQTLSSDEASHLSGVKLPIDVRNWDRIETELDNKSICEGFVDIPIYNRKDHDLSDTIHSSVCPSVAADADNSDKNDTIWEQSVFNEPFDLL